MNYHCGGELELGLGTPTQSSAKSMTNKFLTFWNGWISYTKCWRVPDQIIVLYEVKTACLTREELNLNFVYFVYILKQIHEASHESAEYITYIT